MHPEGRAPVLPADGAIVYAKAAPALRAPLLEIAEGARQGLDGMHCRLRVAGEPFPRRLTSARTHVDDGADRLLEQPEPEAPRAALARDDAVAGPSGQILDLTFGDRPNQSFAPQTAWNL